MHLENNLKSNKIHNLDFINRELSLRKKLIKIHIEKNIKRFNKLHDKKSFITKI